MRIFLLAALVACAPPQRTNMSSVYTATADAIVSGGAVQITEPDDGDLASAASNNVPEEKLADIVKKLVNKSLLAGLTPGTLDTHMPFGLMWCSETGNDDERVRFYSNWLYETGNLNRQFLVSINAAYDYDTNLWTRDTALVDAKLFVVAVDQVRVQHRDASTSATWAQSGWADEVLTRIGAASAAGSGQIKMASVHLVGGGGEPAFQNSWANTGGDHQPARFWKDPFGMVHVDGVVTSGATSTAIFTLPAAYRPSAIVQSGALGGTGGAGVEVHATGPTAGQVIAFFSGSLSGSGFGFSIGFR